MFTAVRVAVESPLLQLDREFDFLVPESLKSRVAWGSRVKFSFGRTKSVYTGFVVELLKSSKFAKTPIEDVLGEYPVLNKELYGFCCEVAKRQVVATGEILGLAIPSNMPRTPIDPREDAKQPSTFLVTRKVLLTSSQEKVGDWFLPAWARAFIERARGFQDLSLSSILIAPEAADVDVLVKAAEHFQIPVIVWDVSKKSTRFANYHKALNQVRIIIGTRSAIYAPVANLGFIAVADDSDESYREVGSPKTNLRDLALLRAGKSVSLLFAAPYRSVELQRLVEIGYFTELETTTKTPKISFSKPGVRIDDASFNLAKEALSRGTLLVLTPRKGASSAAFCGDCGDRLKCGCGGFIWEASKDSFSCRLCAKPISHCRGCRSTSFKRGRSGSTRTTAEIGKMFASAVIHEATQEKKPDLINRVNQVVVATPGSAPRIQHGYSGLLVLDTDVWLSAQHLSAEQFALRDWAEAVELLNPDARVVLAGVGDNLGRPFALWQLVEIARASYLESKQLSLPPAVRVVTISGTTAQLAVADAKISELNGKLIRSDGKRAVYKFAYSNGSAIASELRAIATTAKSVMRGTKTVRGFSVSMDNLEEI
jgi:primosomal protein N' (replication factor Y) (superfamily II helicase)